MAPRIPGRKRQKRPRRFESHRSRELQSDPIDVPQFNSQASPTHDFLPPQQEKFETRRHSPQSLHQSSGNVSRQLPVHASCHLPPSCIRVSRKRLPDPMSPGTPDPRLSSPLGNSLRTPTPNISRVRTSAPRPCLSQSQMISASRNISAKVASSPEKTPSSPGLLSAQPSLLLLSLSRSSIPSNRRSVPTPVSPHCIDDNGRGTPGEPVSRPRRLSFGAPASPCQECAIDEINKPESPVFEAVNESHLLRSSEPHGSLFRKPRSVISPKNANFKCDEHRREKAFCFRGSSVFSPKEFSAQTSLEEKPRGCRSMIVNAFQASHMFTPKSTSTFAEVAGLFSPKQTETVGEQQRRFILTEVEIEASVDGEQEGSEIESVSTAPPSPVLGKIRKPIEGDVENERRDCALDGVYCRPVEVSIPGGALRSPSYSDSSVAEQQ